VPLLLAALAGTSCREATSGLGEPDDSGSEPDAVVDAAVADAAAADAAAEREVVTISNVPEPCWLRRVIAPELPSEAGHLAAAVVGPVDRSGQVVRVRYWLEDDRLPQCDSTLAHRVELAVVSEPEPPARPGAMGVATIRVGAAPDAARGRHVDVAVADGPIVAAGAWIVVAVSLEARAQAAAPPDRSLCLETCDDEAPRAGESWWSNAAEAPYDWSDLAPLGFAPLSTTVELRILE
jgi:hypothetical protein